MLELPESLTVAKQLNQTVRGKQIAFAEAGHTKHTFAWYEGAPEAYGEIMVGRTIGTAEGIGCMVDIGLGEYHLVVGDGTRLRLFQPGERLPERYQARIDFEDGSSLICSVQMYGAIYLVPSEKIEQNYDNYYYWVGKEKPMPGTEGFDYDYFRSLQEDTSGTLSAKAFLATQQRIPGLGNGVLQDILLEAGLHPKRRINTLREADWKRTYEAVVKVLREMTEGGGRDTEKDLFGCPGRYLTRLSKKTAGGPCPYCGSVIRKASYLGGTIYYCPDCQHL